MSTSGRKRLVVHFLRHGQATHNVNAEPMRAAGCSFAEFFEQMRVDDELDALLTPAGVAQARAVGESAAALCVAEVMRKSDVPPWIVASPHRRAVDTADLVFPAARVDPGPIRAMREEWREISGALVNAKRLPRSVLAQTYGERTDGGPGAPGSWDCSQIPSEEDMLWTEELEDPLDCASRAYLGLRHLWEQAPGDAATVAAHGGIFQMMTTLHPLIVADEGMRRRFSNCELRSCVVTADQVQGARIYGSAVDVSAGGGGSRSSPSLVPTHMREAWREYIDKKGRASIYTDQLVTRFHLTSIDDEMPAVAEEEAKL